MTNEEIKDHLIRGGKFNVNGRFDIKNNPIIYWLTIAKSTPFYRVNCNVYFVKSKTMVNGFLEDRITLFSLDILFNKNYFSIPYYEITPII